MNNRKIIVFTFLWVLSNLVMMAQSPLQYLETNYPKLTELYRNDLSKYPAHYVFAIDVSGTMNKYAGVVVPSLSAFIDALPDNDKVSVIPFGTEAKDQMMGFFGVISPQMKNTLKMNMTHLYQNPNFDRSFMAHTDIQKAMDAVSKTIRNNHEYNVNIVIVLTDFRNDVPYNSPNECKLTNNQLEAIDTDFGAATYGLYTRNIALQLPVNRNAAGYCLDQLREKVFGSQENGLEIVDVGNDNSAISQWFEQLKRDIMTIKLRAIVDCENKLKPVVLKTDVDIDGNVTAHVSWSPSKLYPTLKIDSTFVSQEGFYFDNDTSNYQQTRDSVLNLELGRIEHKSWFFHEMRDSINLGLSLPTCYDDELLRLSIKKPLAESLSPVNQWIFTFFLSFMLTAIIVVLTLLYIAAVCYAAMRNAKVKFKGKVRVTECESGDKLVDDMTVPATTIFTIGGGGKPIRVDGVSWKIEVKKESVSPFLIFAKPKFKWSAAGGCGVVNNSGKKMGYIEPAHKIASLNCADQRFSNWREEKTHIVTITMTTKY